MKRLLSLLLCSLFVLVLLCGCGGSKLNSFTWFVEDIPANLDPQVAASSADVIACTHLYSGLFRKQADGTLENAACQSYTLSPDGRTYTFTLESGQPYVGNRNTGTDYTVCAQDFVFAFRRVFDAKTASPYTTSFSGIENSAAVLAGTQPLSALGVSAPDEQTLIIRLSAPDENFLMRLTLPGAMPCNEAFFDSTNGSYGLNSRTILTNGLFYLYNWTDNGLFLRRPESGSAVNSLRLVQNTEAGSPTPAELIENEKCSAALDIGSEETALNTISYSDTTWSLVFNCTSVFAQTSLRQALAAAAQSVAPPADGTLYTAAEGLVPSGATVDGYDYRKSAGAALTHLGDGDQLYNDGLANVGVESLKGLSLLVPESFDPQYVQALNALWQTEYSLFLNIETVDDEAFAARYAAGSFTVAVAPLTLTQSDPLALLSPFSAGGCTGYSNGEFDALLRQAAALSGEERIRLLAQAERLLTQDCAATPLFAQQKRLLVDPAFSGLRFEPYGPVLDVNHATIR